MKVLRAPVTVNKRDDRLNVPRKGLIQLKISKKKPLDTYDTDTFDRPIDYQNVPKEVRQQAQ